MQRSKINIAFAHLKDFVVDKYRAIVVTAAVKYTVTYSVDFFHAFDCAVLFVYKHFKHQLERAFVVGHRLLYHNLFAAYFLF